MKGYVESSLELHLFYIRIMKEHAYFLEIGFMKANEQCKEDARWFKEKFEDLLCKVIQCSDGVVGRDVIDSGEAITAFTLCSEQKTCKLTGVPLDMDVTKLEEAFVDRCKKDEKCDCMDKGKMDMVKELNCYTIKLLDKFIDFQKWLINKINCCDIAMHLYPSLVEHITREAEMYMATLMSIESNGCLEKQNGQDMVEFWVEGMKDHAATIGGLLDPTEYELHAEADVFVSTFEKLLDGVRKMEEFIACPLMSEVINETMELRDFKAGVTKAINDCLLRGMILPLLADHVLREVNYFIRHLMNPDE